MNKYSAVRVEPALHYICSLAAAANIKNCYATWDFTVRFQVVLSNFYWSRWEVFHFLQFLELFLG